MPSPPGDNQKRLPEEPCAEVRERFERQALEVRFLPVSMTGAMTSCGGRSSAD